MSIAGPVLEAPPRDGLGDRDLPIVLIGIRGTPGLDPRFDLLSLPAAESSPAPALRAPDDDPPPAPDGHVPDDVPASS